MLRSTLLWLSERQGLFSFAKTNVLARRFATRFVAGETLDDAIGAAKTLNDQGIGASLDLLGESVTDVATAEAARDTVLQLLDRVHTHLEGDTNISIKLTQLGQDLSDDICIANAQRVLERASQYGVFVRLDMEGSPYTQRTLDLFYKHLHPEFGSTTGVVMQSYMRRTQADVERLVEIGARVRLCKGAYAEDESIAYQQREDVSQSYRRAVDVLLKQGNYPGVATHDEDLINYVTNFVKTQHISADRFEFQMLYGVRRDLQRKLKADGFNVRVYVPFGTEWYPYLMRRLAERPSNVMFMTASVIKESLALK